MGAWLVVAAMAGMPLLKTLSLMAVGSFGSTFAIEQTMRAATPLLLTGLAVALPVQAGLLVIGVEGAFVFGGLAAAVCALLVPGPLSLSLMLVGGMTAGAFLVGLSGVLKAWRGVHEAMSSILLTYLAVAIANQLIEGVLRDPDSLDKPATQSIGEAAKIGEIGLGTLHWGLPIGIVACILAYAFITHTPAGFAVRVHGGNVEAARFAGFSPGKVVVAMCLLSGALGGLAGAIEVGAVQHQASASLSQGYGYVGILVAMLARGNMLAVILAAVLVGALEAGGGMLQRQLGAPAASASLMEGLLFVALVASGTLQGRFARSWSTAWKARHA